MLIGLRSIRNLLIVTVRGSTSEVKIWQIWVTLYLIWNPFENIHIAERRLICTEQISISLSQRCKNVQLGSSRYIFHPPPDEVGAVGYAAAQDVRLSVYSVRIFVSGVDLGNALGGFFTYCTHTFLRGCRCALCGLWHSTYLNRRP